MAAVAFQGKYRLGALILSAALAACAGARRDPAKEKLVDIDSVAPEIMVEIKYSTADNFTRRVLYPANRCLLRESVAKRLMKAQRELERMDLGLKVWDCYRPLSIQTQLWELVKDPRYVADPKKGSRHNRGAAVDATLVDAFGQELAMPTLYDDFSERAHRGSKEASVPAAAHSELLEKVMSKHGFVGLPTEWWHFDAEGWAAYPLSDVPLTDPGQ